MNRLLKFIKENSIFGKVFSILITVILTAIFIFLTDSSRHDTRVWWILLTLVPIFIAMGVIVAVNTFKAKNVRATPYIKKCQKYTVYLKRLATLNAYTIKSNFQSNGLPLNELGHTASPFNLKDQDTIIKGLTYEKEALLALLPNAPHPSSTKKISSATLKRALKRAFKHDKEHAYRIFDIMYQNIWDLRRIFLDLEQYNLRINLGNYIVSNTNDIDKEINGYLDLLGWTYVLKHQETKGLDAINKALELINYKLQSCSPNSSEYYHYLFLKARALRHKGTVYYTYFWKDKKECYEALTQGINLLDNTSVKDYFESQHQINKYDDMLYGLKYNLCLFNYYEAIQEHNINELSHILTVLDDISHKTENTLKEHFKVKIKALEVQIQHHLNCIQENKIANPKSIDIQANLSFIESALDHNIYFDEAIETYLSEKIAQLYDDIIALYTTKKEA